MSNKAISPEDLLECLERSGYLLESRIVRELDARGYFVEPNQVLQDPRTGKSREIDFVAEHYSYVPEHRDLCVKTSFIGEVINNRLPIVLLTSRPSTPNSNFESYVKFGLTPEPAPFFDKLDIFEAKGPPQHLLFAQYCALSIKKGEAREIMASHPDDLYGSLQKLSEYTEEQVEDFESWASESKSEIWRAFFWHPIIVAGGQLYAVDVDDAGTPHAREVSSAFLEFNWHQDDDRKTTVIEVVQLRYLFDRLQAITQTDQAIEKKLYVLRQQHAKGESA